MKRKTFIKSFLGIISAPFIFPLVENKNENIKLLKPQRLNKGDKAAIIAPGAYIEKKELDLAIENVKSLGLEPIYREDIISQFGYLAGTDKRRADEINEMFSRKDIKAIFCARGGYGSLRLLELIDYDLISANPKVFVGYSDITALQFAILKKSGLVSLHGPVGISSFDEFSSYYLRLFLFENFNSLIYENYLAADRGDPICLYPGEGEGTAIGGNLSLLVSLIGSDFDIDYDDKIIFIEETDEEPYRIDRMLTQLTLANKFKKAKGIIFGIFNNCEKRNVNPAYEKSFELIEVLKYFAEKIKLPCSYGFSFGHAANKFSLPQGLRFYFNSTKSQLVLLENFVK